MRAGQVYWVGMFNLSMMSPPRIECLGPEKLILIPRTVKCEFGIDDNRGGGSTLVTGGTPSE